MSMFWRVKGWVDVKRHHLRRSARSRHMESGRQGRATWRPPLRFWVAGPLRLGIIAAVGDAAILAWVAWVVSGWKTGEPQKGIVSALVLPIIFLAPPLTVFLLRRYSRTQHRYRAKAKDRPEDLVPTAGSVHKGEVVGRDQLCNTLIGDLRAADRQPHILIGGVGTGKTAVLVELTYQLAQSGAIPVNVRLRDAQDRLDFADLAKRQLLSELDSELITSGEGDRIWRQLRRDNKVVVLADGLEEALVTETDAAKDRDSVIRLAIGAASKQGLPLVIASRPHDPLRAVDAILTQLEPLGEGPAMDYVQDGASTYHHGQLARMIQDAHVSNAPLYLQMVRQLYREAPSKWEQLSDERDTGRLTRSDGTTDRFWWRLRLFEHWREALEEGYLYEDHALSRDVRIQAVECLSTMACVGLVKKRLDVSFDELVNLGSHSRDGRTREATYREILLRQASATVQHRVGDAIQAANADEWSDQLSFAAVVGSELGIVDTSPHGVRFKHSLMQAYLGSRYISAAMEDEVFREAAYDRPSRELLVALILDSRTERYLADRVDAARRGRSNQDVRANQLRERANAIGGGHSAATLEMYTAALEIDSTPQRRLAQVSEGIDETESSVDDSEGASEECGDLVVPIANDVADRWARLETSEAFTRPLDEAKLRMVMLLGRLARAFADRDAYHTSARRLYRSLYDIASHESGYAIRLAAVQQVSDGGGPAFEELLPDFQARWDSDRGGGSGDNNDDNVDLRWRRRVVCAWLAPTLYYSTGTVEARPGAPGQRAARDNLITWVRDLARFDPERPGAYPNVSAEIALAQGFRLVANRRGDRDVRVGGPASQRDQRTRTVLVELAEEALSYSHFWFSQLVLIQALALWSLPDDPAESLPERGHGSHAEAAVQRWLAMAGGRSPHGVNDGRSNPHPFVREAGALAVLAMESRNPGSYLWIDESGVLGQVGSSSTNLRPRQGTRDVWILPSTGWTALAPRARLLAAEVLMMLNLAERGDDPASRDKHLSRASRPDLPPCMTFDRSPLDVSRKVGSAGNSDPGTRCLDDCAFRLCPYPPVGEPTFRAELTEDLCRVLSSERGRGAWQRKLGTREAGRFWLEMSRRTRPRPD